MFHWGGQSVFFFFVFDFQRPAPGSWFPGSSVSSTWPTLKRGRGFGTGTSELDEAQPGALFVLGSVVYPLVI